MKIYAGNLSFQMTGKELKTAFEFYGYVRAAAVIKNRKNGRSRGFGYVEMPNRDEMLCAIDALDGKEINGKPLKVKALSSRPVYLNR